METMPGAAFHPAMLKGSVSSLLAMPGARLSVWLGALSSATREAMGLELVPQLSALITTDAACEWLNASGLLKANPVVVTKWFEQLAALAPDVAERELTVVEDRDAAVIGLLHAVGQREREAAFAWLPQIHDSKLRAAEAQSQWIAWAHEDRVAALAWFTSEEALGLLDSSSRATLTKLYAVQL